MATSNSRGSGASSGSGEPSPAEEQVLAHLETVLASPVFSSSRRCQKLLRYVVENALFGRAARLKERTIGIEVFGRPPAYEPSEDAIVRVNANEVRKRLAQHYLKAGREGVWIDLPSGAYVPEFQFGPPAATTSAPAPPAAPPPPETPPLPEPPGWRATGGGATPWPPSWWPPQFGWPTSFGPKVRSSSSGRR